VLSSNGVSLRPVVHVYNTQKLVPVSQETSVSIKNKKISRLMLFREAVTVYFEIYTKHTVHFVGEK
jgi:hypothetical protein